MTPSKLHTPCRIGISMGDPAGVGPEIVARAISDLAVNTYCVFGSSAAMARACDLVAPDLEMRLISHPIEAQAGCLNLIETTRDAANFAPSYGQVNRDAGAASLDAIYSGIRSAMAGEIDGLVTAPIHKEAIAAAGCKHFGHTELLREAAGTDRVAMMLMNSKLRVVLATVHCPLHQAIQQLDIESEYAAIAFADEACRKLGIAEPRIAVAGLNPHAGEGGLLGDEEQTLITPAIERARSVGMNVTGPLPGDTVFMRAKCGENTKGEFAKGEFAKGEFDCVVAQYHDQGLIPIKYEGVASGVNVTLGLPFVRTSPDHGTAFDIAGKGIADPSGLRLAIEMAETLVATAKLANS